MNRHTTKLAVLIVLLTLASPAWASIFSVSTLGAVAYYDTANRVGAQDTATDGASVYTEYCFHSSDIRTNCDGLVVQQVNNSSGSGTTVWANVNPGTSTRVTFRAHRGGPYFNQSSWAGAPS